MLQRIKDLFEIGRAEFFKQTGQNPSGVAEAILWAVSTISAKFLVFILGFITKNSFITTAEDDYLARLTGGILKPYSQSKSQGTVIFTGIEGTAIPQGTQINNSTDYYITDQSYTISKFEIPSLEGVMQGDLVKVETNESLVTGEYQIWSGSETPQTTQVTAYSGYILFTAPSGLILNDINISQIRALASVTAEEYGEKNIGLNQTITLSEQTTGIDNDVKVFQISGGQDTETVTEFRTRVIEWKRLYLAHFSKDHIISKVKEKLLSLQRPLHNVWVRGDNNRLEILALNQDFDLTLYEQEQIKAEALLLKTAPFPEANTSVTKPSVVLVDVEIEGLSPNTDEMRNAISEQLNELFIELTLKEPDVAISDIELTRAISLAQVGTEHPTFFRIVSGSRPKITDTYYKFNSLQA